jgi:hypothetical protein
MRFQSHVLILVPVSHRCYRRGTWALAVRYCLSASAASATKLCSFAGGFAKERDAQNQPVALRPDACCILICTYLRERINGCLRRAGPAIACIDGSRCAVQLRTSLVIGRRRRRGCGAISQHRSKFPGRNWPCMFLLSTHVCTSCILPGRPTYLRLLWRTSPCPGALQGSHRRCARR